MKQTAVEYLEYMFILQNAIYKNDIDKALEMEKEQEERAYKRGQKHKKPLKDSNPINKYLKSE